MKTVQNVWKSEKEKSIWNTENQIVVVSKDLWHMLVKVIVECSNPAKQSFILLSLKGSDVTLNTDRKQH